MPTDYCYVTELKDTKHIASFNSNHTKIKIHLENPTDGYNVNVDIMPAYAQQVVEGQEGQKQKAVRFGVSVKLDVNNRQLDQDMEAEEIGAILDFSDDYLSNRLLKFLNNERD